MRHLKSGRKLKRTASHRKATLSSLSVSLIQHKKIRTTVAKAKETRMVVEKLITRAKNAVQKETGATMKDVHARRIVFSFLRDRQAVSTLFNDIAQKVSTRPGGYTRVVKLGRRHGDGAELAVIELVDYNTGQEKAVAKPAAAKQRARKKGESKTRPAKAESKQEPQATSAESSVSSGSQPKDSSTKA